MTVYYDERLTLYGKILTYGNQDSVNDHCAAVNEDYNSTISVEATEGGVTRVCHLLINDTENNQLNPDIMAMLETSHGIGNRLFCIGGFIHFFNLIFSSMPVAPYF